MTPIEIMVLLAVMVILILPARTRVGGEGKVAGASGKPPID